MFKFNYAFYIEVDVNGKQRPFITFSHGENYKHLGNLAFGRMSKSVRIKEILSEIGNVLTDEKEEYQFAGDDWCIVNFKKDKSTITNGVFDSFEPFEMDSNLILRLMQDWYKFLLTWENGEIPGITYSPAKGGFV